MAWSLCLQKQGESSHKQGLTTKESDMPQSTFDLLFNFSGAAPSEASPESMNRAALTNRSDIYFRDEGRRPETSDILWGFEWILNLCHEALPRILNTLSRKLLNSFEPMPFRELIAVSMEPPLGR
jgi:hypothetical protein